MDHTPRSKIYADNHKGSGIYTENSITNLTISGFDYNINLKNKWLRTFRIFSLTDDYYIACFYMIGYSMYFLCDQFDGLVKLLVDYKICDEPVNEGNIFKEEDYYTEMLYDDACEMVHLKNRIAFSDKEVNILKDISDKKGYKYSIQDRDRGTTTIEGSCINFYKYSPNIDGVRRFKQVLSDLTKSIYKFDDEWYIFMRYNKKMSGLSEVYYKCDGFEGLLRCINDMMPDIEETSSNRIDESLSDCDYYSKISTSKFLELVFSEIDIQRYYKTISDCINNNFSEECPGIRLKHRKVIVVDFKRFLFGIKRIDIFLVDDEYFIVDVFETGDKSVFYKCDQIDGLIQLLNDLKTFRTNTYSLDESLDTQESLVRRVEIDPRL